jgi:hypothetical protein
MDTETEGETMSPREKETKTTQVALRLPKKLLERLDEHAKRMSAAMPGLTFTRVDAVKSLLTKALDEAEAEAKRRKP